MNIVFIQKKTFFLILLIFLVILSGCAIEGQKASLLTSPHSEKISPETSSQNQILLKEEDEKEQEEKIIKEEKAVSEENDSFEIIPLEDFPDMYAEDFPEDTDDIGAREYGFEREMMEEDMFLDGGESRISVDENFLEGLER